MELLVVSFVPFLTTLECLIICANRSSTYVLHMTVYAVKIMAGGVKMRLQILMIHVAPSN